MNWGYGTNTMEYLHSAVAVVYKWALALLCSALWSHVALSWLKGTAAAPGSTKALINSITHTSVNTNAAKTNPSLFTLCLRSNKSPRCALCLFFYLSRGTLEIVSGPGSISNSGTEAPAALSAEQTHRYSRARLHCAFVLLCVSVSLLVLDAFDNKV